MYLGNECSGFSSNRNPIEITVSHSFLSHHHVGHSALGIGFVEDLGVIFDVGQYNNANMAFPKTVPTATEQLPNFSYIPILQPFSTISITFTSLGFPTSLVSVSNTAILLQFIPSLNIHLHNRHHSLPLTKIAILLSRVIISEISHRQHRARLAHIVQTSFLQSPPRSI